MDPEKVLETLDTYMINLFKEEGEVRSNYENVRRPRRILDFENEEGLVTRVKARIT